MERKEERRKGNGRRNRRRKERRRRKEEENDGKEEEESRVAEKRGQTSFRQLIIRQLLGDFGKDANCKIASDTNEKISEFAVFCRVEQMREKCGSKCKLAGAGLKFL